MINPADFVKELNKISIDFYAGVPDSLLKGFCAYIQDNVLSKNNVITANEGGAVALGAGHYLGTGKPALVYMQNSGQGNGVNPLLSLNDPLVYGIPVLLMIGWRGEPGIKDEPQHAKQGQVTLKLLEAMNIDYTILSSDTDPSEISSILTKAKDNFSRGESFALVVKKGTFVEYSLQSKNDDISELAREEAISRVSEMIGDTGFIVSTTGMISRELYESRDRRNENHNRDFLTVGSMGHASQIAAGIALGNTEKRVFCFDGDGAFIMQMGNIPIAASLDLTNFYHIVFNNSAHDSVGGQPTVAGKISLRGIAKESGYRTVYMADDINSLNRFFLKMMEEDGPALLEVRVKKGARKDLGRPKMTPKEQMNNFMNTIKDGGK